MVAKKRFISATRYSYFSLSINHEQNLKSLLFAFDFSFRLETLTITAVFFELILNKEQRKLFVENTKQILHSIVMSHTSLTA
ncbi:unnamed protein product [Commensalibacter communis]|nr:unnamed protein product [Commensalibacter communis]